MLWMWKTNQGVMNMSKEAQPKQEQNKPLAWKHYTDPLERRLEHLQSKANQNSFDKHEASALKHVLEIVKQPQQRTWVGLTVEEIDNITAHKLKWQVLDLCLAIEAKLKEKNT